jgi:hypothetical protein
MKPTFSAVKILIFVSIAALIASCGAPPILMKPAANKVKKIALVSVTANRGVRNLEGQTKMGSIMAMTSLIKSKTEDKTKKKDDDSFDFGGNNLVNFAAETFNAEFSQIKGWELIPSAEIMDTDAYRKFSRNMKAYSDSLLGEGAASKAVSAMMDAASISADGMPAVVADGRSPEEKQMLTELAQDLNIDAVVVLEVDMAFSASTAIGGTGTAAAAAGIGIVMVNKYGDYVIQSKDLSHDKSFDGFRVRSENTTAMVAGNIIYTATAEAMFKDSISKGIQMIKTGINAEMK